MGLKLQSVASRQGWTWARDGVRLFLRRPIAFSAMLMLFLIVFIVWSMLPLVGLLVLAALPLLSLGFMVGSRSVLRGGLAHPGQFVQPLFGDARRRRHLLLLCGLYGLGAWAVVLVTRWTYGDALDVLLQAIATHGMASEQAMQANADPRLGRGMLVLTLAGSALSVPFWHAPALVVWGGQSAWQALFSSAFGLWRAKGAYLVYSMAWVLGAVLTSLVLGLVGGMLGPSSMVGLLAVGLMLTLSTAFYVSLWFSFVDCFGSPDEADPAAPLDGAAT
jgi:hypothetical protein